MSLTVYSQKKPIKKASSVTYSEEQALEYIKDYYEFYNADETYSTPKVRRISNNVFYISLDYCNAGDSCFQQYDSYRTRQDIFWRSKVLILTISPNDKYTVKVKPRD